MPPDEPTFGQQVTFLYVQDLEVSSRFYGDLLGLPLALDQGACRIYTVTPTAFIGLCTCRDTPRPADVILTLVTEDVRAWQTRLETAGVPLETPTRYNPRFDITHLFVRDPDGYRVEIQHFHAPNWPTPEP